MVTLRLAASNLQLAEWRISSSTPGLLKPSPSIGDSPVCYSRPRQCGRPHCSPHRRPRAICVRRFDDLATARRQRDPSASSHCRTDDPRQSSRPRALRTISLRWTVANGWALLLTVRPTCCCSTSPDSLAGRMAILRLHRWRSGAAENFPLLCALFRVLQTRNAHA